MTTAILPTERKVMQFDHATVIFTVDHSAATGKAMPKLYVQAIDQYRFQRELSIQFRHRPGDSKDLYWECHVYQHPGRREISEVSPSVAKRFIARFLELCDQHPDLLFSPADDRRARHEGFVHLAEWLHRGADLSAELLNY